MTHKPIPLYSLKKNNTNFAKVKITNSKDAAEFIRQFYSDDLAIFESFFLLLLSQSGNTIGYAKISQGGIAGTVVDPLLVAKYVTDSLAKRVILCHNHPSGTLKPSQQDLDITNKIQKMLSYFDVNVSDHVILTEESYYSFADEGIL